MEILSCSKADFDQILLEITEFWGNDRTLHLHHPMFLYEFGNSAYVIRDGDKVIAYLFGFLSQTGPIGYVHLIGVRRSHQRRGLGTHLYDHFIAFVKKHGYKEIKAITTPTNIQSISFHKKLEWNCWEILMSLGSQSSRIIVVWEEMQLCFIRTSDIH